MFDYVVIGGGVVGTAILNKLTRLGKKTALVEIQNDVGFGASRANSALIHSGIDCKVGTLKAKLNVRGSELFEGLCERLEVPYKRCGHIIAGNDKEKLDDLMGGAKNNGVQGCKLITDKELKKLEPNINEDITMAIFAPSGAIISSYELAVAFAEESVINGAEVFLEFDTKKIVKTKNNGFTLISKDGRSINALNIINACGAGVNHINKLLKAEEYDLEFRRGEYFILDKQENGYVNHPVFPLPTEKSKGILVTPTIHGNILVGPTSVASSLSTKTTKEGLNKIKQDAVKNFKTIPFNKNIRVFSGVRVLCGEDFVIEKSKKVNGLITLAGICSPGLSACPAIAEYVAGLLDLDPNAEIKNLKLRPKKIVLNELTLEEQNQIINKNPDYGKVVCKCENISLGEIKDAINSVVPAKSVDAVKRRTRAGMGRCQGGFCIFEVMEQLKEQDGNSSWLNVKKDGVNSNILVTQIKPTKKGK